MKNSSILFLPNYSNSGGDEIIPSINFIMWDIEKSPITPRDAIDDGQEDNASLVHSDTQRSKIRGH